MGCIGEEGLARYLAGDLDHGVHREVEAHLQHCGPCNHILDELTMRTEIRAVGGDPTGQLDVAAPSSDKIMWLERHYGLQIGDEIDGKYHIEKVIGEGGMGIVVRATHLALREKVALKFMHPSMAKNPVHSARFIREARAAVRLREEHVARVLDLGEVAENGPYIVMEYLEGLDLLAYLKRAAPLRIAEAIELARQAASGVAAAHEAGIVHRDLKPGNMFVTEKRGEKVLKVLDFGVSKYLEGDSLAVTGTNMVVGSPMYMAPELFETARNATPASDVWALGVILYRMVTGRLPFFGETLPELVAKVHFGAPTPIAHWRPEVPREVIELVDRCLSRQAAARFRDGRALLEALTQLPSSVRSHAQAPTTRSPALDRVEPFTLADAPGMSASAPMPAPATAVPPPARSRRPWLFAIVGAAIASALFLGILSASKDFAGRGQQAPAKSGNKDSKPAESNPSEGNTAPPSELAPAADEPVELPAITPLDAAPTPIDAAAPEPRSERRRSRSRRGRRRVEPRPRKKPKEPVLLIPEGE